MIRINLLDSVTDRAGGMAAVEARVSNPRTKMLLVGLSIAGLLVLGMGLDFVSAVAKLAAAETEQKSQQEIARQMAAINKEQGELEKKTKDVQARIDVIKRLRSSQKGPVAVLSSINERLPRLPEFFLTSIEQKGEELTVMGNSPNEGAVTSFGRSLEFSNGLFANVNIETQRKLVESPAADRGAHADAEKSQPKPETVTFTIRCKYTPPGQEKQQQPQQQANGAAPAAQNGTPQVAKN
ncbi:MAG TPA: PilN domain-containing protein [Pyrinomonadaceae bacterium]|nr:PilN domain-containing protein [Pyrinomonadaceae bacterium]